ncbi:MAG: hypothetical protein JW937_08525 [Candidatus Omnitrophica bacterium]|nr:hypothetical protein [Candidatus Omnitrophota bacterium]
MPKSSPAVRIAFIIGLWATLACVLPAPVFAIIREQSFPSSTDPNFDRELIMDKTVTRLTKILSVDAGYRVDNLDWNIAGTLAGTSPNVLSELTWEDIQSFEVAAALKGPFWKNVYARGRFSYGWIYHGQNQDSDYHGDNRTLEFSRSRNSTDDGSVVDATLGFGYQFSLSQDRLKLSPLLGFARHEQNFKMTDGNQITDPYGEIGWLGPFEGLNSTYDAAWSGPWLGLDFELYPFDKLSFSGNLEHHWVDYDGVGDWNLRPDLAHPQSFAHSAEGTGHKASIAGHYKLNKRWRLNASFEYYNFSTDEGTDTTHAASGLTDDTQLNEVNWDAGSFKFGAAYLW